MADGAAVFDAEPPEGAERSFGQLKRSTVWPPPFVNDLDCSREQRLHHAFRCLGVERAQVGQPVSHCRHGVARTEHAQQVVGIWYAVGQLFAGLDLASGGYAQRSAVEWAEEPSGTRTEVHSTPPHSVYDQSGV
ncbi:hypothetical protein [Streptomyces sp. NPDC056304]|uniref:hypothetical protein n=1 Tax=Streptomyces sp. NPDC056304 TaxID=3345778 RepID=UPI0035D8AC3A